MQNQNPIKQCIREALQESLIPDSNAAQSAAQKLQQLAELPQFYIASMEVADDPNNRIPIRQGALIQLKNNIKKYWDHQDKSIPAETKNQITDALLVAFIRSANNRLLVKIYREIVSTVIGFEYRNWIPIQPLLESIQNNRNLPEILQFIVAICTNFEYSIKDEERMYFYNFILEILPCLFDLMQRNHDPQLIYLTVKILWKTVHYEIDGAVRNAVTGWMDILLLIQGSANPNFESAIQEIQDKGTCQFYYFHTKKWATRILYRYIYRHANPTPTYLMSEEVKEANIQFSKKWYESYGQKIIETLVYQFSVPTIKKVRYFQLKCLSGIIKQQPVQMKDYAQTFQYSILLSYLKLEPEDEQTANYDPVEFMSKEEDSTVNYSNLKKAATEVWTSFSEIDSKKKGLLSKANSPGACFYDNLNFLKSKLECNNTLEKQMAMYLICELKWTISSCKETAQLLPSLISKYVVEEFRSQIMFIRARAVEIFKEYGDLTYSVDGLKKAVEGIYFCLVSDTVPLVRLKAATAFHVLLGHREARDRVKPLFQQILKAYLELIEKYDLQEIVHSLTAIVEYFSVEVSPYAEKLMNYLSRHFIKLYNKDNEQSQQNDYDGETQLAAAGILNTMKILLQSPIEESSIGRMEDDILFVCEFIFASDESDYIEDVMGVLKAYTFKANKISESLLFFYVLCIYYVTGINREHWGLIENLPLSTERKKALNSVRAGCNIETLESVMPVLRNFIYKDSELLFRTSDMFGINLTELMFCMIRQIYQKGPDEYDGEVEMNNCTILTVYLIENNYRKWPENVVNYIFETVLKENLEKAKSKLLRSLTAQLFCVLVWNYPQYVITKSLQYKDFLRQALEMVTAAEPTLKQEHQRQRVILGLSTLFAMDEKPAMMLSLVPKLFVLLVNLVRKNCELRVDLSNDENYQTESDEQEEEIHLDENDEPEDIWEEDYGNCHHDKLDEIDEVKLFKESMQSLNQKQNAFYSQLTQLIHQQKLLELNGLVEKAIESYGKQVQER